MTGKQPNNKKLNGSVKQASSWSLFYQLVAYIYLAAFVIGIMEFGFSPLLFCLFIVVTAIFILPLPTLGLGLIVALTFIFERWFTLSALTLEQSVYKIYPLDIVILITGLALIIQLLKKSSRPVLFFKTPEKILGLFMLITVLNFLRSLFNLDADLSVAFSTLKNYAFYPLLYFLVIFIIQDRKKFKNLINVILLAGLSLIVFIIIGFVSGQGLWTEFTPLSTSGVRLLAGTHAFYLVISSLIIISLLGASRFWNNALPGLLLWFWGIGILVSLMRHLWLAFFFGLAVLFALSYWENKKNIAAFSGKNMLVILSIIMLAVFVASLWPLQNWPSDLTDYSLNLKARAVSLLSAASDTSVNWRLNLWESAKKNWLGNPIFGIGFGLKIPLEMPDWRTFEEIRNIHNSLLAILIQMGILGLLVFGLTVITTITHSWKKLFADHDLYPYYLGLVAGLGALLFSSLFQPYFETNLTGIFLWLLLGLIRTSEIIVDKNTATK